MIFHGNIIILKLLCIINKTVLGIAMWGFHTVKTNTVTGNEIFLVGTKYVKLRDNIKSVTPYAQFLISLEQILIISFK